MFSKTSHKDVAKDKVAEVATAVSDAAGAAVGDAAETARQKATPVVESAAERLSDAADAAQPQVAKVTRKARKSARKAAKKAAKTARAASDQAYAALPDQARTTVETVAPQVAKRHKKGKLFIALGLVAGAAAVALFVRGKQHSGGGAVEATDLPEVERRDAAAAEDATEPVAVSGGDDAVGDAEQQADEAVSGRKGRHAAQD